MSLADEIVVAGGETKTIENCDVKGVWVKQGSKLTATNVNFIDGGEENNEVAIDGDGSEFNMTGGSITVPDGKFSVNGYSANAALENVKVTSGAYANGGGIDFTDCTVSGDILYAGHEWENNAPKEEGDTGSFDIYGGTVSVNTLWGYDSDIEIYKTEVKTKLAKLTDSRLQVCHGQFVADSVEMKNSSLWLALGVEATLGDIELKDGSSLTVGTGEGNATTVTINNLTADGSIIKVGSFLDTLKPEVSVSTITLKNDSMMAFQEGTLTTKELILDGDTGEFTISGVGTLYADKMLIKKAKLIFSCASEAAVMTTGLDEGDALAASASDGVVVDVKESLSIDGGTVEVKDGAKLTTEKIEMKDGSEIAVSGSGSTYTIEGEDNTLSGSAKISATGGGAVSMAEGSAIHAEADDNNNVKNVISADGTSSVDVSKGTLYISNAKKDGTVYNVSSAVTSGDEAKGQDFGAVYGASRRMAGIEQDENGNYIFASNIDEVAKDSPISHVLKAADAAEGALTDFMDTAFGEGTTDEEGNSAMEHVAAMSEMLGVTHGTYSFAQDVSDLVADHAGEGSGIWAEYIRQDKKVDGFKALGRSAKYDVDYNGFVIGGDFATKENSRTGLAFAYAKGSNTEKDGVSGKNDTKYYGLDVYHHFKAGGISYKADIGFVKSDNDLKQTQLGTAITGDVSGNAFFLGIRAEKAYAVGKSTLTPYVGLRYYRIHTGDFTDSLGMKHETGNANLWNLPIGVIFKHETKGAAWNVTPVVELGYNFVLGGKDAKETVRFGDASDTFAFDVAESAFFARLGLEANCKTWNFGGGYRYQKGSDTQSNRWYLQVGYNF